jgi:two-component system, OmpR family, sensor kinase
MLERLLAIPAADLGNALDHACTAVGEALHADKVDAFLYDDSRDSLVALGTSATPLSSLQKKLGLDVLPVSNGGRVVYVFQTGETYVTGRLCADPEELRGIKEAMKIQSQVGVPLQVGEQRQGMLMVASLEPDFFGPEDVEFTESVARWVGMVAHRAELTHEVTKNAAEQGRRKLAEELITVLAHDLKNFITPISARLHVLRIRAEHSQRSEDLQDAEHALGGVRRLAHLISDLLDTARLDQGIFQLEVEPVDLGQLTQEIARSLSTPDHELQVEVREETIVVADPHRIRQCLENVMSNAVQHSPHAAPVALTVHTQLKGGKLWGVVEIHNEGPGIPPDLLPQIFERFVAGPGSRGLGLGLYLAKQIASSHEGDLLVESAPGEGARFWLRLPALVGTLNNGSSE